MTIRRSLCALVAIVLCASTASAQDPSKIGITMGYPASVGILWNASNTIAIRPTIDFAGTSATESGVATSTDRSVTLGADVLFYVRKYDRLRTYVAPHVDYAHGSNRSQPTADGSAISGNSSAVGSLPPTSGSSNAWGTRADRSDLLSVRRAADSD
ncbi:MAG TPA: hypothetical protein VGL62_05675 [Vicinamibacterales bacterium]|jgi:hypothetical protein